MERAFFEHFFKKYIWNPENSGDFQARSSLKNPQDWLLKAIKNQSGAGVHVDYNNTTAIPAAYRCVSLLSSIPSKLPIHVFEKTSTGKKVLENDKRDRMLHLKPNEFHTISKLLEISEATRQLRGNALLGIIRDFSGTPQYLELIPRQYTEIKPDNGKVFYHQKMNFLGEKVDKVWRHENIINVPNFSSNGIIGHSTIEHHKATLGLAIATHTSAERFYKNGANFEGFLKTPVGSKPLTDPQKDGLRKDWNVQTEGVDKHHKTPLLEYGIEFVPISMPLKDAQFLESREFSGLEVCQIFNVPPSKAYFLKDAHYNNVSQLNTEFYIDTVLTQLTQWEQEYNSKLFFENEQGKKFAKFNVKSLLRGDIKTQV